MKKYLVLVVALHFAFAANAQLLGSVNFDPKKLAQVKDSTIISNQLFEDAIRSAFFLSRQSFQISDKKTGDLYGLNNQDEFGTEITLGVKVKNGFVLSDKAVRPWDFNDKFETYKESYTPVPYISEYSEFSSTAKYDTLDISQPKELLMKSLYLISSECFAGNGLMVDCTKGEKEGWIVWIGTDKDDDLNKTANLRLTYYSKTMDASEKEDIDIETPNGQNILGGIYIVPVKAAIGVLEFRICGIIMKNGEKWSIRFPFIGKENLLKHEKEKMKQEDKIDNGKDNLTPINNINSPKASKDKKSRKKSKKKS